jgi:hypothetical protein
MIGEKCECCGDEVLILKNLNGKRLCLDCYYQQKDDRTNLSNNDSEHTQNNTDNRFVEPHQCEDRRCPNCGRIIPFNSVICPYCGKRFETFL